MNLINDTATDGDRMVSESLVVASEQCDVDRCGNTMAPLRCQHHLKQVGAHIVERVILLP
ncbi:hypothetical protein BEL07_27330 [Mycolicibacterium grossiae]|uniref:Uncharacterized protein n=1 Tax=Mycolicibacterium grossiae TaxID=1552759 RepID=A0A1E8PW91_9MYCO|nr:hypothetical protein BEL07_27330 [Mycolicibacterium grossiae]